MALAHWTERRRTIVGLHPTLKSAVELTEPGSDVRTAAGTSWNDEGSNTLGAWDFGTENQIPALNYADYDGTGDVFSCDSNLGFPANVCGTLLPGQDEASVSGFSSTLAAGAAVTLTGSLRYGRIGQFASFSWRQLAGPEVALSEDEAQETTFRAPGVRDLLVFELTATDDDGRRYRIRISLGVDVDVDDDGLIEIYSLLDLHNMRHNLAGTSYKGSSTTSVGNSLGCPATVCKGYELMQDLDFDGGDDDGGTWSVNDDGEYILDLNDSDADYFPVDENGEGGWEPIGDAEDPFVAVFDGNGNAISNLAISRGLTDIGLFAAIGEGAAIRNLGLIDNLARYSGISNDRVNIGGLVGSNDGGSITASYVTGAAASGDGNVNAVGGLVGSHFLGSITASYATGPAAGGDGGNDYVGGLVGIQSGGSITASYARGAAAGGGGSSDYVGGLVGWGNGGSITASYATGPAAGSGTGDNDYVGALVGRAAGSFLVTASYGFGEITGGIEESANLAGTGRPEGVDTAAELTANNVPSSFWDDASNNTMGAWSFDETPIPALNYADYDGDGDVFACTDFPVGACGTLLPGQLYVVVVSVARLEVDEGGNASYNLRLPFAPTELVEVVVDVPSGYNLAASPTSLFFDDVAQGQAGHWGTDQRVTLSLDEDGLSSGTRVVTVEHRVISTDPSYQGLEVPSVEVTLIDNDPLPSLRLFLIPPNAVRRAQRQPR